METTGNERSAGRTAARELLNRASRPWKLKSFALGWTRVDVLLRMLMVLLLAIIPIEMTRQVNDHMRANEARLREHSARSVDIAIGKIKCSPTEIANHYANLADLAGEYQTKAEILGRVQICGLGLLGILVVLAAIGEYQRFIAQKTLKSAVDYLRTPEGGAVLQSEGTPPSPKA